MPPLTGEASNVTMVPAQTLLADAVMETLTGRIGFTVIVTVLEVAGFPDVQVALDVTVQFIVFPLAGINVYDEFVSPETRIPLRFHW